MPKFNVFNVSFEGNENVHFSLQHNFEYEIRQLLGKSQDLQLGYQRIITRSLTVLTSRANSKIV